MASSTNEVPEIDTITSSDDKRSVGDYEKLSAIYRRFKEFVVNLESTKKRVAEVKKSPKELRRDIIDELEEELDDK